MSEDLSVWDEFTPQDTQDLLQAALVECVELFSFFLSP